MIATTEHRRRKKNVQAGTKYNRKSKTTDLTSKQSVLNVKKAFAKSDVKEKLILSNEKENNWKERLKNVRQLKDSKESIQYNNDMFNESSMYLYAILK